MFTIFQQWCLFKITESQDYSREMNDVKAEMNRLTGRKYDELEVPQNGISINVF